MPITSSVGVANRRGTLRFKYGASWTQDVIKAANAVKDLLNAQCYYRYGALRFVAEKELTPSDVDKLRGLQLRPLDKVFTDLPVVAPTVRGWTPSMALFPKEKPAPAAATAATSEDAAPNKKAAPAKPPLDPDVRKLNASTTVGPRQWQVATASTGFAAEILKMDFEYAVVRFPKGTGAARADPKHNGHGITLMTSRGEIAIFVGDAVADPTAAAAAAATSGAGGAGGSGGTHTHTNTNTNTPTTTTNTPTTNQAQSAEAAAPAATPTQQN